MLNPPRHNSLRSALPVCFAALLGVGACSDEPLGGLAPTADDQHTEVIGEAESRGSKARIKGIVLTPGAVELAPGGQQTFTAVALMNDGSTASLRVQYSATGGTISSDGLYTAGPAAGPATVIAAFRNMRDSARVVVQATSDPDSGDDPADPSEPESPEQPDEPSEPADAPVASVSVTLGSASLAVGETTDVAVTLYDADGHRLTGREVSLTSSNDAVAAISSTGVVSAVASGSAAITAVSEGQTGSAVVQVTTVAIDGIRIEPGDDIQAMVDAAPTGSAFILAAGTHRGQSITPKSGNSFVGESGAIMDGDGTVRYAFQGMASDVRIEGLIVQNYAPPEQMGAIKAGGHTAADGSSGWIIERSEIRYNKPGGGIRIGHRMKVRDSHVHHNGQIGIVGVGDDVLIEGNEIAFNNYEKQSDYQWEAGGTKFVKTKNLVVRRNYVHDNWGPGLWTDIDNIGVLMENNRVVGNAATGIFHEISQSAVIRNNHVEGNGFDYSPWVWGAGILVAASEDTEVYGNTVVGNANGIALVQQDRGTSSTYGERILRNVHVYNNSVDMSHGGRTGVAQDVGDSSIFTDRDLRFSGNHYRLGTNARPFEWANGQRTEAEWAAGGHDATGTFTR